MVGSVLVEVYREVLRKYYVRSRFRIWLKEGMCYIVKMVQIPGMIFAWVVAGEVFRHDICDGLGIDAYDLQENYQLAGSRASETRLPCACAQLLDLVVT